MIIKCRFCKKEFDKPSRRNQHEEDAHKKEIAVSNKVRADWQADYARADKEMNGEDAQ